MEKPIIRRRAAADVFGVSIRTASVGLDRAKCSELPEGTG